MPFAAEPAEPPGPANVSALASSGQGRGQVPVCGQGRAAAAPPPPVAAGPPWAGWLGGSPGPDSGRAAARWVPRASGGGPGRPGSGDAGRAAPAPLPQRLLPAAGSAGPGLPLLPKPAAPGRCRLPGAWRGRSSRRRSGAAPGAGRYDGVSRRCGRSQRHQMSWC